MMREQTIDRQESAAPRFPTDIIYDCFGLDRLSDMKKESDGMYVLAEET